MTTTPNPTAAEHEHATTLCMAWLCVDPAPPLDVIVARCYLALKAQLAESERRVARLRAFEPVGNVEDLAMWRAVLAADQTTARESAENTAEETMPERCRVRIWDNGDMTSCERAMPCPDHGEPVPAQPPEPEAHAEYCNLTCDEGGHHAGQCRYICGPGNAKAQPPEPVEPSRITANDARERLIATKNKYINHIGHDDAEANAALTLYNAGIDEGYRAGLAAEAAAHARYVEQLLVRIAKGNELRQVSDAELAKETKRADSCCGHAAYGDEKFGSLRDAFEASEEQLKDARAELERVRAELATAHADIRALSNAAHAESLRSQARARRVPTREALAELMYRVICARESPNAWKALHAKPREMYLETADAVLRLFAVADATEPGCACTHEAGDSLCPRHPTCSECGESATAPEYLCAKHAQPEPLVTSDDEPPVPLPKVLPAGSRYLRTTLGDLYLRGNGAYTDTDGSRVEAREVDWSHYRAQQRAAEATPEAAWNYEAPPDSEIGEMHELKPSEYDIGIPASAEYRGLYDGCPSWGDEPGQFMMDEDCSVAAWRPASAAPAPEPDSAWLKRTVEELTTARPVEVIEDELGHLHVSTTGDEEAQLVSFRAYVDERHVEGIRSILAGKRWPMRRDAKPAEPSPQPGGELDALTRRVEALERFRGSLICVLRQHVRALDSFDDFHEALDGVVAVSSIEREERSKK